MVTVSKPAFVLSFFKLFFQSTLRWRKTKSTIHVQNCCNICWFVIFCFFVVPGMPFDLQAYPVSSAAITVKWKPPTNPNGKITSYTVKWNERLHFSRSLRASSPFGGSREKSRESSTRKRRECEGRWTKAHSRVHSRLTSHTINGELASRLWTPGTGLLNEIFANFDFGYLKKGRCCYYYTQKSMNTRNIPQTWESKTESDIGF